MAEYGNQQEPVLYAELLSQDAEQSIARIALRGINKRTINHLSSTTYEVVFGEGSMEIDGTILALRDGVKVTVPVGTPYQDEGHVVMIATSLPPFNLETVEELK